MITNSDWEFPAELRGQTEQTEPDTQLSSELYFEGQSQVSWQGLAHFLYLVILPYNHNHHHHTITIITSSLPYNHNHYHHHHTITISITITITNLNHNITILQQLQS